MTEAPGDLRLDALRARLAERGLVDLATALGSDRASVERPPGVCYPGVVMPAATPCTIPAPRGRPPRALVVLDPPPEEVGAPVDWSAWYLTDEEDMGEGAEQHDIIAVVEAVLKELARERGWEDVRVAGDQFFAWVPEEPLVRVSPDVYLLDDPPPPPLPASWQTWCEGHGPPRFAVELVSGDEEHPARWRKDYEEGPAKYAQLGTSELVVFDPEAGAGRAAGERVPLQVFRRDADGTFVRVYTGAGPARSEELDAWLVVVRQGPVARLRVARDAAGRDGDEVGDACDLCSAVAARTGAGTLSRSARQAGVSASAWNRVRICSSRYSSRSASSRCSSSARSSAGCPSRHGSRVDSASLPPRKMDTTLRQVSSCALISWSMKVSKGGRSAMSLARSRLRTGRRSMAHSVRQTGSTTTAA